jgi:hypothetical protein
MKLLLALPAPSFVLSITSLFRNIRFYEFSQACQGG